MIYNMEDVNKKHWAYLLDRIQYFQRKPQLFGTQLNADDSIYPVVNLEELKTLRLEYFLPMSCFSHKWSASFLSERYMIALAVVISGTAPAVMILKIINSCSISGFKNTVESKCL